MKNITETKATKATKARKGEKTMKKITNNDRRKIMLYAHAICNHGKAMKWADALKKAWTAWKTGTLASVYEIANAPKFGTVDYWLAELARATEDGTLAKFAHYRLASMVGRSITETLPDGSQVDYQLSVSAQKAYIRFGFYGYQTECYEDYLQNTCLHTVRLIRSENWIARMNARREEAGKNPIEKITDIIWYGSERGWQATVKQTVHRMRTTKKAREASKAIGEHLGQYEYFNIDSTEARAERTGHTDDGVIDTEFNRRSLPSYGEVDTVLAIASVTRDATDRKIVRMKFNEYTQAQIATACKMGQSQVSKRLKRMLSEYHASK